MNSDELEYIDEEKPQGGGQQKAAPKAGHRLDPRCELESQALLSIPPLNSRVCEVHEISRGGMFLAFTDAVTTLVEMEKADIETGAYADVAFAALVDGERHRFNLRGRIARISRRGIGLQFVTHNPPQLAALREFLPRGGTTSACTQTGSNSCWSNWRARPHSQRTR